MRVMYRVVLVGMLLSCCHEMVSMIQALQALADQNNQASGGASPNSSFPQPGPSGPPPSMMPSPEPSNPPPPPPPPSMMPSPEPSNDSPPASMMPSSGPSGPSPVNMSSSSAPKSSVANQKKTQDPKAVKAQATLVVSDVQTTGLDTINIDSGGNWLEKRIWFEKAQKLFDEIRLTVEKASDMRMEFVQEVNAIGKKIDDFYDQVSFEKGQIDEILKHIVFDMSQAEAKRGGDLSSHERSVKMAGHVEQKQIEQIGNDIKKVDEFDSQIDKAMMQAFKTIDDCRSLEGKAWNNFKSIGAELDDKKARTLYYEMENFQKNIQQNIQYLQTTLLPYVQTKLVASAEQVMATIQASVKALDAKGIHLDELVKGYEKKDVAIEQERQEQTEKDVEQAWEKQHEAKVGKGDPSEAKGDAKKQKPESEAWYTRFVEWAVHGTRCVICKVVGFVQPWTDKIYDLAPGFFGAISHGVKTVWNYVSELFSLVGCYAKCMLCSIKSWICHLFGK